jgi:hypothetical protein
MESLEISISADASPILDVVGLLSELPLEVVNRFIDAVERGVEIARFDLNRPPASRACDLRITLQPSDFVLEFMSATGTPDRDFFVRENV